MIKLTIGSTQKVMPENWQECQKHQILALTKLKVLHGPYNNNPDSVAESTWLAVIATLLNLNKTDSKKFKLARFQFAQLRKLCLWVFTLPNEGKPMNHFVHKGITYILPEDDYANSDAIDVAWANECYAAFVNPDNPNTEALDQLIATICRPERPDLKDFRKSKDWDGDTREVFNSFLVQQRAKEIADLDIATKITIFHYWEQMNNRFLKANEELFGSTEGTTKEIEMGWVMMLKDVAKEGYLGTFAAVCEQNAHFVWQTIRDGLRKSKNQNKPTDTE